MKIETKYSVGDTVYAALVERGNKRETCPDCLGRKTWHADLPSGEELDFSCPTCTHGYEVRGYIDSYAVTGRVAAYTIGNVRFNDGDDEGVKYMCEETGVGTGLLWKEVDLYATELDALAVLPAKVEAQEIAHAETRARSLARRRKDRVASMVSHYRRQIRHAKRDIEDAERGLEREAAKQRTEEKQ